MALPRHVRAGGRRPKWLIYLNDNGVTLEDFNHIRQGWLKHRINFFYNTKRKEFWASRYGGADDAPNTCGLLVLHLGFGSALDYIRNPEKLVEDFAQRYPS